MFNSTSIADGRCIACVDLGLQFRSICLCPRCGQAVVNQAPACAGVLALRASIFRACALRLPILTLSPLLGM